MLPTPASPPPLLLQFHNGVCALRKASPSHRSQVPSQAPAAPPLPLAPWPALEALCRSVAHTCTAEGCLGSVPGAMDLRKQPRHGGTWAGSCQDLSISQDGSTHPLGPRLPLEWGLLRLPQPSSLHNRAMPCGSPGVSAGGHGACGPCCRSGLPVWLQCAAAAPGTRQPGEGQPRGPGEAPQPFLLHAVLGGHQ